MFLSYFFNDSFLVIILYSKLLLLLVLLVKYCHCTPITPSRRTKLWKDAATVRAIGVPNIVQKRCQPPPGEVGGAKLKRHFHRTP